MRVPRAPSFHDRPGAVALLRRNSYSVRYSLWRDFGTPSESGSQSLKFPTPDQGWKLSQAL